jgi:hypothetical protein
LGAALNSPAAVMTHRGEVLRRRAQSAKGKAPLPGSQQRLTRELLPGKRPEVNP